MSLIVSYRRTPYGKLLGSLQGFSAMSLGEIATRAALADSGLSPSDVDFTVAGQVLQAGQGQNPARQTAVAAGIPLSVPAITLNSVCLSGMEAVALGHRLISTGEAKTVVCVGQESMTTAPHILKNSRTGTKYGATEVIDSLEIDGLTDAFGHCSMGSSTEKGNKERNIDREAQDKWAVTSHHRAANSASFLAGEIVPISVQLRKETLPIETDEGVRGDASSDSLASLHPAFGEGGTITAGNASPISDGAACIVLMDEETASARKIQGMARVISNATVAGPDTQLHSQPSAAISRALEIAGRSIADCARFEINEAFASVVLQSMKDLGLDPRQVNCHGGAIALGHPIGSSGTRIVGTLARQLQEVGPGTLGAAGICGGGGQGSAMIIEAIH